MTTRQVIISVLFGLSGMSLASGQQGDDMEKQPSSTRKITSMYLLAHGFKQSATDSDVYMREHVRLADVARDLGFSLKSLRPVLNSDGHSDSRTVDIGGLIFVVRAEFRDKNGNISFESSDGPNGSFVDSTLDDPNAICTIRVWLRKATVREFLKTDSSPRLRIISVAVPEDHSKPLEVKLELGATGKKPVAILRSNFHFYITGGDIPPSLVFSPLFPEGTPQIVVVSPGKPAVFNLGVPVAMVGRLSSGEYSLSLKIHEIKGRGPQTYDYEWEGREHHSNDFKFVIE